MRAEGGREHRLGDDEPRGTIVLMLRAEDGNGAVGDAMLTYKKGDPKYQEILKHVGGLSPGSRSRCAFPERSSRSWATAPAISRRRRGLAAGRTTTGGASASCTWTRSTSSRADNTSSPLPLPTRGEGRSDLLLRLRCFVAGFGSTPSSTPRTASSARRTCFSPKSSFTTSGR